MYKCTDIAYFARTFLSKMFQCANTIAQIKGVNPGGDGGDISPPCFDMGGGITCLLSPPCFDPQICCFFVLEN